MVSSVNHTLQWVPTGLLIEKEPLVLLFVATTTATRAGGIDFFEFDALFQNNAGSDRCSGLRLLTD
jgi:hypothetical protein